MFQLRAGRSKILRPRGTSTSKNFLSAGLSSQNGSRGILLGEFEVVDGAAACKTRKAILPASPGAGDPCLLIQGDGLGAGVPASPLTPRPIFLANRSWLYPDSTEIKENRNTTGPEVMNTTKAESTSQRPQQQICSFSKYTKPARIQGAVQMAL